MRQRRKSRARGAARPLVDGAAAEAAGEIGDEPDPGAESASEDADAEPALDADAESEPDDAGPALDADAESEPDDAEPALDADAGSEPDEEEPDGDFEEEPDGHVEPEQGVGRLKSIVESLLFAADKPLTVKRIRQLTRERDTVQIEAALAELTADYEGRGIVLHEVAGGWQLRTAPRNSTWVQQLIAGRPVRLSRAQLETLAIIAYRQPITRPEIDDIRGVDSGGTLRVLLERHLIRVLGKKEEPGRPLLYGTTKDFLEFFHLSDLRDLPTLREYHELTEDSMREVERLGARLSDLQAGRGSDSGPGDSWDTAEGAAEREAPADVAEASGAVADQDGWDDGEEPARARDVDEPAEAAQQDGWDDDDSARAAADQDGWDDDEPAEAADDDLTEVSMDQESQDDLEEQAPAAAEHDDPADMEGTAELGAEDAASALDEASTADADPEDTGAEGER